MDIINIKPVCERQNAVYLQADTIQFNLKYTNAVLYLSLAGENVISFSSMSQYTLYLNSYARIQKTITSFPKYLVYLCLFDFRCKIDTISNYLIYLASSYEINVKKIPKNLIYLCANVLNMKDNKNIPQYVVDLELYGNFNKLPLYVKQVYLDAEYGQYVENWPDSVTVALYYEEQEELIPEHLLENE
jgi:hypothetical protein